jgi:catechol 2,3-dioxygenase
MRLPSPIFRPPFNITRASHVVLTCQDLERSLAFYEGVAGLIVSDRSGGRAFLRGVEEAAHHSVVLEQATDQPSCRRIGFRVLLDEDLDAAFEYLTLLGRPCVWAEVEHQGRTLVFNDVCGVPIELCATMDTRERLFAKGQALQGAPARRLDHFQVYVPDVGAGIDFYNPLGFRASELIEADDQPIAAFLYRKGNTHDLVLFQGPGPQLHHFAFTVPDSVALLRCCDLAGSLGFGDHIERGPGRHGFEGAFFIYLLDPDGYRIELFDGNYQTIDSELEPRVWQASAGRQPWGFPAQESWFRNASRFEGAELHEPKSMNSPYTLERYLADRAQRSRG